MPTFVTDYNKLPLSPKRLAKAADEAGWTWRAGYASVTIDEASDFWPAGTTIDSIMVSCKKGPGDGFEGVWESVSGEKLELRCVREFTPGQWSKQTGLNEAIAKIVAAPLSSVVVS